MDLKHLRYFVAIIDSGSLSRAADQLGIVQPALSHRISELEGELGKKLLLRSSQGVTPTEAGKTLYRHAQSVLRQVDEARREVEGGHIGESGQVSVGFTASIASVLTLPLLARIRSDYPGIHLQMFESESGYLTELLTHGRLDMAVLFRDTEARGLSVLPLLDEDLFVYGDFDLQAHPDAATCPIRLLDNVPMILPSHSQGLRILLERAFAQAGISLNVIADIDSLASIMTAVEARFACTILPSSSLPRRTQLQTPPVRRLIEPCLQRPVSLCWASSTPRFSASLRVQQIIIELVAELVGKGAWNGARLRPVQP